MVAGEYFFITLGDVIVEVTDRAMFHATRNACNLS